MNFFDIFAIFARHFTSQLVNFIVNIKVANATKSTCTKV